MLKRLLFLCSVCLLTSATFAHADSIFTLTLDGCTGTCGTAPFGTIQLVQTTPTLVTVTETLSAGERFAGTGAGDALEFNVLGPITINVLTSGFAIGPGPDSASTFGTFLKVGYLHYLPGWQGQQSNGSAGVHGHFRWRRQHYGFHC